MIGLNSYNPLLCNPSAHFLIPFKQNYLGIFIAKNKENGKSNNKKAGAKKAASKKGGTKKNKLGVKNSLVNNINAKKKKGTAASKKRSTISKKAYKDMEDNWSKKK
jgi:hypothetical protein